MGASSLHMRVHQYGDGAQIKAEVLEVLPPGPGEVQIRHVAIGVNFVDIYHRTGRYPLPGLPATLGVEGAGVVEAVGPGVHDIHPGQRVAYAGPPVGGYAVLRNLPAGRVAGLPASVSFESAAGALLRGITAHMLFAHVRALRAGDTVLVHAAAGGLGLILVQWAKSMGAKVIGTVGSEAKGALARRYGADRTVLYRTEDFVAAAREFTAGEGVDFAVDGIGGSMLSRTLATVRPYGMAATIGQVAGDIGMIDPQDLGPARSIALARPGVMRFMEDQARYREGVAATLGQLASGMQVPIGAQLPLAEAAQAHRLLEAGMTTGAVLLRP